VFCFNLWLLLTTAMTSVLFFGRYYILYHNRSEVPPTEEHASEILDLLINVEGCDLNLSYSDEAIDCDKNTM
jgi:hypothetical protein